MKLFTLIIVLLTFGCSAEEPSTKLDMNQTADLVDMKVLEDQGGTDLGPDEGVDMGTDMKEVDCCGDVCGEQACDPTTCECATPNVCANLGDSCNESGELLCVSGVCRKACADGCGAGEVCVDRLYCLSTECEIFDACDRGKCIPVAEDLNACLYPGEGIDGESCDVDTQCSGNLRCHFGQCRPSNCTNTGVGICVESQQCVDFSDKKWDPTGTCLDSCQALESDVCPEGQKCHMSVASQVPGDLLGGCVNAGSKHENEECTFGECGEGLFCYENLCKPFCPGDELNPVCGAKECVLIDFTDHGRCEETCDPDSAIDTCNSEWCAPILNTAGVGVCTPAGTKTAGEDCRTSLCEEGLVCFTGVCQTPCDHPQQVSADSDCAANEACLGIGRLDGPGRYPWGFCSGACDFNHSDPLKPTLECADPTKVCHVGEFFGFGTLDICLPPSIVLPRHQDCSEAGIGERQFCGPDALCVDRLGTGTPYCLQVCTVNNGPLAGPHPDCSEPNTNCRYYTNEFGFCD